eukprot:3665730-Alexandrium_andersonii.AAC.1
MRAHAQDSRKASRCRSRVCEARRGRLSILKDFGGAPCVELLLVRPRENGGADAVVRHRGVL